MSNGTEILLPRWIVPVQPEGSVLEDHGVVIEKGRIAAVGPADGLAASYPDARVTRCPIMP